MSEERKNVLIVSLGMAEGVVTTAVDALKKIDVEINEVLTLSTIAEDICYKEEGIPKPLDKVERLQNEFETYEPYNGKIKYDFDCIEREDMMEDEACEEFFCLARKYLNEYNALGYSVYVCLAGGRKSMSGVLATAAQFFGATMIFHIAITDEHELQEMREREKRGDDSKLHPNNSEVVKLPFFNLRPIIESENGLAELSKKYGVDYAGQYKEIVDTCKSLRGS